MKHVTTALCRLLERLNIYLISSVTLCRAVEVVNCCLSTTVNDKLKSIKIMLLLCHLCYVQVILCDATLKLGEQAFKQMSYQTTCSW